MLPVPPWLATTVFGRRIERILHGSEGPEVTRFAYAGNRVIEETDDTGGALATYVYGNYIDEVITMRRR